MLAALIDRDATMIGMTPRGERPPVIWRLLGATELGRINIIKMPKQEFTEQEFERAKALFPEVSVCQE